MTKKEKQQDKNNTLWQEMAELTYGQCQNSCKCLGSCCSASYCEIAEDYAKTKGIKFKKTGNTIPYLTNEGKCVIPPQYRWFCTIQQCDISSLGSFKGKPELTERYYVLRERLDKLISVEIGEF
jgi:hypothetical protein